MLTKLCVTMKPLAYIILPFLLLNQASSHDLKEIFETINKDYEKFNIISASLEWEMAVKPKNHDLPLRAEENLVQRLEWLRNTCMALGELREQQGFSKIQQRQAYLLCRGPKYTDEEAKKLVIIQRNLQSIYSDAKTCLPVNKYPTNNKQKESTILNYMKAVKRVLKDDSIVMAAKAAAFIDKDNDMADEDVFCLRGEDDFNKIMKYSRRENVLRWVWLLWREIVVRPIKKPFDNLLDIHQKAARRNGYENIGVSWRDEMEVPNLRELSRHLYLSIRPFYTLLHGVTRFFLRRYYGNIVPEKGPIPAHLLGDLWSQNWESLIDLITNDILDIDKRIRQLKWTAKHMVQNADDFYRSLGLPKMTKLFWRNSIFDQKNHTTRCHGTAADMFREDDYRILYCSGTTLTDMYVLLHEMGHIQYYMAYSHLPGIFRNGNTAVHETIGDTAMLAVMMPQHLNRLGLINDSILYNDDMSYQDYDEEYMGDIAEEIEPYIVTTKTKRSKTKVVNTNDSKTKTKERKNKRRNKRDSSSKSRKSEPKINKAVKQTINREHISNKSVTKSKKTFETTTDKNKMKNVTLKPKVRTIRNDSMTEITKLELTPDEFLMLKLALRKIPQIPFALLMDEFRWDYFERSIDVRHANKEFWDLALELQGITPPEVRTEEYFDVAAIFHVPDNTPYIRYFLSSFLQHQLFEKLCKAVVYGRQKLKDKKPLSIKLHRCDIYGSHRAGDVLKDIMSRGNSQTWQQIVVAATQEGTINAEALKRYYRPLQQVLLRFVKLNRIPLGW